MRLRLIAGTVAVVLPGLALVGPVHGQDARAGWTTLASGDEVLAVAVDPAQANVLWAGTEAGGLVRWDVAARTYTQHLYPAQPGLDSNQIRDIAFDATGNPWLATARGVTFAGGTWRTYHEADGLPTEDITAIAVTSDGSVWAGTRGDGVAQLAAGSNVWVVHAFDEDAEGPGANHVSDIAVASDDGVWVAHGRAATGRQPALSVRTAATGEWRHISAAAADGSDPGPPTDQLMALVFDDAGTLWVGSWAQGVLEYDGSTWTEHGDSPGTCGNKVWAITAAASAIWAACGDDQGGYGASHFDGSVWQTWTTAEGLPTNVVTALAASGDQGYFGTNGPGILGSGIVPVGQSVGEALKTAPSELPVNDVTALEFDDGGRPWVGTRGAGLFVRQGDRWEQFTRAGTSGGLAGDMITDLVWDAGRLWVASTRSVYQPGGYVDGGASAYDPAADSWLTLTSRTSNLPSDEVSSVAVTADGIVWFGLGVSKGEPGDTATVYAGDGVAAYDPATDTFVEAFDFDNSGEGLAGNTVNDVAIASDGVWAAAAYHIDSTQRRRGGGASRFGAGAWTAWRGGDSGFTSFHGSGIASDLDPFITGDVRSVFANPDGTVWAGTWDLEGGSLSNIWPFVDAVVNRFDGTMWEATTWAGSGWVSAIATDGSGRTWAGTTRGHDGREFDPAGGSSLDTAVGGVRLYQSGQWQVLTPSSSGLASTAITAITVDPSTGDVWFGTENEGISVFGSGVVLPTITPGGPTNTPRPPETPTQQTVATVAATRPPGAAPTATGGSGPPVGRATPEPPKDVPEPATMLLMGAGLAGLAALRRRRQGTTGGAV